MTHYLIRESTINLLSFRELTMNSLSVLRTNYKFTWSSVSVVRRIHYYVEFTIIFANSLYIHCFYQKFSMNQLEVSQESLWIHYLFRVSTMNSLFRKFTMNQRDVSRIHYKFTVYIVNQVRILVVVRWFSLNTVGVSRTYFEFTI